MRTLSQTAVTDGLLQRVKRIAIIAPEFPPDLGGMQRYAWEVAEGLGRLGFQVTVFTMNRSLDGLPATQVEILPCLDGSHWLDKRIIAARARDFDVWHVMNSAWAWVARFVKPVFLTVYGNDFLSPNPVVRPGLRERFNLPFGSRLDLLLAHWLTARSVRKSLPLIDHIFAISRATNDMFLERFPFCRGKTSVTLLGVSDFFLHSGQRAPRRCGPRQLITICRMSERRKNVDMVIRALARLKDVHEFQYAVVGDGPLRPALEQLARALGVSERVTFVGSCSDETLRERLLSSDLFILTSSASRTSVEGFGIVYLEANACGVPVLAARVGGAIEAVDAGRSGMFVDAITPDGLTDALDKFLSGKISFDSESCRAFARQFSWPTILDRILHGYSEIAAR
jgi:glycosyltransferase involved in cell wall biosynthesis